MAPGPVCGVPASANDVWRWASVSLRLAATTPVWIDAQWLAALAKDNDAQYRNPDACRATDLAGCSWPIRAGARSDYVSRSLDRRLAVLCPAPVRSHLLDP